MDSNFELDIKLTAEHKRFISRLRLIFNTCRVYIAVLQQRLQTSHPVIIRRLKWIDASLNSLTERCFSKYDIRDESIYLLILMLQNLYRILYCHVEKEFLPRFQVVEVSPSISVTLTVTSHKQILVLFDKLLDVLRVMIKSRRRIENFVTQLDNQIRRSARYSDQLENVVTASEMWTDHLMALSISLTANEGHEQIHSISLAIQHIRWLMHDIW